MNFLRTTILFVATASTLGCLPPFPPVFPPVLPPGVQRTIEEQRIKDSPALNKYVRDNCINLGITPGIMGAPYIRCSIGEITSVQKDSLSAGGPYTVEIEFQLIVGNPRCCPVTKVPQIVEIIYDDVIIPPPLLPTFGLKFGEGPLNGTVENGSEVVKAAEEAANTAQAAANAVQAADFVKAAQQAAKEAEAVANAVRGNKRVGALPPKQERLREEERIRNSPHLNAELKKQERHITYISGVDQRSPNTPCKCYRVICVPNDPSRCGMSAEVVEIVADGPPILCGPKRFALKFEDGFVEHDSKDVSSQ